MSLLEKKEKLRRSFNLTKEILNTLDDISRERHINKSEIVETALKNLFKQLEEEKKDK